MIDLPTKMLKELEEEGSLLPQAVIFHNLAELAAKQGNLKVTKKGDETRIQGMVTINANGKMKIKDVNKKILGIVKADTKKGGYVKIEI